MRRTLIVAVLAAAVFGSGGFLLGRSSGAATVESPARNGDRPSGPGGIGESTTGPSMLVKHPCPRGNVGTTDLRHDSERSPSDPPAPCDQELARARAAIKTAGAERDEKEGKPIPLPTTPPAPRFAKTALTTALGQAFAQTRIPGAVDGVDCSEYPCITFGRIRGAEDQMTKLEHARSLAVYEEDIMTVLLWAATDEEGKVDAEAHQKSDDGLEQSLFAVALYTRAERAQLGDNLDRRIRARTAELWNSMSPADETAAH